MKELLDIVRAWKAAGDEDQMVLITVTDIKGSTYRRPGAHLLLVGNQAFGSISGGCLENDLISTAWDRTENGPVSAVFDTTSDEDALFGYGLGCRGIVTVFLRRVDREDPQLQFFSSHLDGRKSTTLVTQLDGPQVGQVRELATRESILPPDVSACTSLLGGVQHFVEKIEPLLNLHIYGAGFDAPPLAKMAAELGWRSFIYDQRSELLSPARFPDSTLCTVRFAEFSPLSDEYSAHVILTHNFEHDLHVLEKLLPLNVRYLGVLGPRARTERLLQTLNLEERLNIIRSPIGLDIGAETPHEIALAIVAEIQAVFRSRVAGFLKDRPKRIHREQALIR